MDSTKESLARSQERRAIFSMRIQMAYRQRLGRRSLWRRRKLTIHTRETKASIVIQCAMRVYLSRKRVRRQRALVRYRKFLSLLRPWITYKIEELEHYAAVKMQVAFRRRQAYLRAKKLRGARAYYLKMKSRYPLRMEDVPDHAATHVQCAWKSRSARRTRALMTLERERNRRIRAAVRLQKVMRGKQARKTVQKERNTKKMRRLGTFFRDACFLKCWMNWIEYTDKARHFKEVVGRVLRRWFNRGIVRSFNAMAMYAEMKDDKRQKVHKAAIMASKHRMGPRNRIWGYLADFMDDIREIYTQVTTKCSSFLHLLTGNFVKLALAEWKAIMLKSLKATRRRRNYRQFSTWKGWQTCILESKHFSKISTTIRSRWTSLTAKSALLEYKDNVDDLRFNRSLVGDALLVWINEAVIRAFRTLYENAQMQIHYRKTVENFRRRFRLRGAMPMVRMWQDYASTKGEHKRIAKMAAFNLYRKAIAGCLAMWVSTVQDKKINDRELAAKNSHILLRILKRPMVICFALWKDWYEELRKNRRIVARISYRWRNANVVLCFRNWIGFVDIVIEQRRETLKVAVLDAIKNGDLATLMQEAKRQQRRYQRGNLEDVMKEVLAEEDNQVEEMVGHHVAGLRHYPRKAPAVAAPKNSSVYNKKAVKSERPTKIARSSSSFAERHDGIPPRGSELERRATRGLTMPDLLDRSAEDRRVPLKQILPAYLRGQPQPHAKGVRAVDDSVLSSALSASDLKGAASAITIALDIPAPQFTWDGVPSLNVGDTTAYPLLGFDAELPNRSYDDVKESLSQFQNIAARGKKAPNLFPAIRESKTAWPQIDDREEISVGMTGNITEARPDVKLPRVVPAPITVPAIVDD